MLSKDEKQKIQDIVDARLRILSAARGNSNAVAEFIDISYDLAKAMQTKSFFLGGQIPPKN